jgi:SPP1 gp7 family putative phage head morphogenesis protein
MVKPTLPNPTRVDPSRMNGIHKQFTEGFRVRLQAIKDALVAYLSEPMTKTRYTFLTNPQKVDDIQRKLQYYFSIYAIGVGWIEKLIARAYISGVERSFDEIRTPLLKPSEVQPAKAEFLKQIVNPPLQIVPVKYGSISERNPISSTVIKVYNAESKLNKVPRPLPPRDSWGQFMSDKAHELSMRLAEGWKRQVDVLSEAIAKVVTAGIELGESVEEIVAGIKDVVTGIPLSRATAIAQTEVTRAHAEGQLDSMIKLGVRYVEGIPEVEFTTAGDFRVCRLCGSLAGSRLPIDQARGKIPVHVRCRCAWKAAPINLPVQS